jgi:hypothetical protein
MKTNEEDSHGFAPLIPAIVRSCCRLRGVGIDCGKGRELAWHHGHRDQDRPERAL